MNGYTPRYYISGVGTLNFEYKIPDDATEGTPQSLEIPPFTLRVSNEDGSITYTQGPKSLIINATGIDKKVAPGENFDEVYFIEGTLSTLTVNGIENITLDNIDDNRRLYFPVKYVAENGIFIANTLPDGMENYDFWEKTNYLSTKALGTKAFKLDYDSSMGLPYIEFPSDIANLIESGLTVRYIVSSGSYGNIQANKLCKITAPANLLDKSTGQEIKIPTDYITLSNTSSILNGKNPETIDEMYQSFKKMVHTFNTLVTCKDFQDAIYKMEDANTSVNFVGNDIVTDIKTDYNKSIRVASYDEYGSFIKNIALSNEFGRLKFQATKPENPSIGDIIIEDGILKWYMVDKTSDERDSEGNLIPHWEPFEEISYDDFVKASEAITPFDICVYALKAFSMADYNPFKPWQAHSNSFEPPVGEEAVELYTHKIIPGLDKLKCINHQFTTPKSGDIICFKNYVPLRITIIPYSRVTARERDGIYDNIYKALSVNFNSRMVDFGEELIYDTVYNVILNADDRIKSIRLEDFEYTPKALVMGHLKNDHSEATDSRGFTEYSLLNDERVGNFLFIDLVAKNVLAGRLCLFDIDDNFDYQYGQINVNEYEDVKVIESEVKIPVEEMTSVVLENGEESSEGILSPDVKSSWYDLVDNEYIELAWPNYYTDITYPQFVYYRFVSSDESKSIPENTEYELESGETITLVWTQNGTTQRKTYGPGQVIKPSFNLTPTRDDAYYKKTGPDGELVSFDILSSNEQIEHKVLLETILNDKGTPVYWITQGNRKLFEDSNVEILNSNEYFLYSNKQRDAMVIFGAGTRLEKNENDGNNWSGVAEVDIDTINDEGFNSNMTWRTFDFTNAPFHIQEMNLLTLTVGDSIHIDLASGSELDTYIGNKWQEFHGEVTYKINVGTPSETEEPIRNNTTFRIRSRLDMTSDKNHSQQLYRGQSITVKLADKSVHVIENDYTGDYEVINDRDRLYYQVNTPIDILGDSATAIEDYLINYKLDIRSFKLKEPIIYDVTNEDNNGTITTDDGNLYITMDYNNARVEIPFSYINKFNTLDVYKNEYVFPIFLDDSKISDEDFVPMHLKVESLNGSESSITANFTHYGRPDLDEFDEDGNLVLKTGGLHSLKLDVHGDWENTSDPSSQESIDVSINEDFNIIITWNTDAAVAEYITLLQYKIIGGLNSELPSDEISLQDVVNRINELLAGSNDSDIAPYLTYLPEKSMALQNEDLTDPTTFWDVNNVANPITIAQIDMETMFSETDNKGKRIGTIDIIKSMKDYTD